MFVLECLSHYFSTPISSSVIYIYIYIYIYPVQVSLGRRARVVAFTRHIDALCRFTSIEPTSNLEDVTNV